MSQPPGAAAYDRGVGLGRFIALGVAAAVLVACALVIQAAARLDGVTVTLVRIAERHVHEAEAMTTTPSDQGQPGMELTTAGTTPGPHRIVVQFSDGRAEETHETDDDGFTETTAGTLTFVDSEGVTHAWATGVWSSYTATPID